MSPSTSRASVPSAVLCGAAALLMVLGRTVPAFADLQTVVWLGVLALLVAAFVAAVGARRDRRHSR
ncbi:hypothetical protein [Curtobacterium sp. MCBA15_001]|uniref:hypothetical protein n=1 Tax=Curtobacterium sp. MCBA15_001 TaxID=1898731 RepID=UPI00111382D8|nr:hypothetical protein [Curtobacterium sp. MCBA15_001]